MSSSDLEKGNTSQINHRNGGAAAAPGQQQLWDPSHAYATRQPSRIGNPGALYVPLSSTDNTR